MPLNDTSVRAAKPRTNQYKLYDDGGLFMIVKPSGGKLWRLKYRYNGKELQLSIGIYPAMGLKDARKRRDEAKRLLGDGIDPGLEKKRKAVAERLNSEITFSAVANELLEKLQADGLAEKTGSLRYFRFVDGPLYAAFYFRRLSGIEPQQMRFRL